jgi:uncharacterized protein (TIGR03435 family)
MRKLVFLAATFFLALSTLHAQDPTGTWQGTLAVPGNGDHPGAKLRLVLIIDKKDSAWTAVLHSIDQGGQPMNGSNVKLQGNAFSFAIAPVNGSYEGKLSADGKTLAGKFTQGEAWDMIFVRTTPETAWDIPAPPTPPKRMAADANPTFDVATIKPGDPAKKGKLIGFQGRHFNAMNFNVNDLIALAYGMHTAQIIGAPAWFATDLYDIDGIPDVEGVPSQKQQNIMMQKLLADRFELKFHHEKKELAVYLITLGKGGPKMTKASGSADDPDAFFFRGFGDLTVRNLTMTEFAVWFQGSVTDKPVVDHTGLTDRYDFTLKWTPDDSQFIQFRGSNPLPPPKENAPPSLYTAVQEQLGLKIESTKADDDVIVIDHVVKATPN